MPGLIGSSASSGLQTDLLQSCMLTRWPRVLVLGKRPDYTCECVSVLQRVEAKKSIKSHHHHQQQQQQLTLLQQRWRAFSSSLHPAGAPSTARSSRRSTTTPAPASVFDLWAGNGSAHHPRI
ncbi:uncharacterized protein V6R79_025634 [Siganus canaliculatus]